MEAMSDRVRKATQQVGASAGQGTGAVPALPTRVPGASLSAPHPCSLLSWSRSTLPACTVSAVGQCVSGFLYQMLCTSRRDLGGLLLVLSPALLS